MNDAGLIGLGLSPDLLIERGAHGLNIHGCTPPQRVRPEANRNPGRRRAQRTNAPLAAAAGRRPKVEQ